MSLILTILLALLSPCASEDDNMCYWNASTNGGHSFIAMTDDFVIYLINTDNNTDTNNA